LRIRPLRLEAEAISSLPSLTLESPILHLAPLEEYEESIEIEGRLLILSLLNKENSLKRNKLIHDKMYHGIDERIIFGKTNLWTICPCPFAKRLRSIDIGSQI